MRLIDPSESEFDAIYRAFRWSIPEKLNIAHQVCERHQGQAQRVAVYYENAAGESARYSFAELKKLSDKFANALRAAGIERACLARRRSSTACATAARARRSCTPAATTISGRYSPGCPI
jgi:acetyl-CoA synthetase